MENQKFEISICLKEDILFDHIEVSDKLILISNSTESLYQLPITNKKVSFTVKRTDKGVLIEGISNDASIVISGKEVSSVLISDNREILIGDFTISIKVTEVAHDYINESTSATVLMTGDGSIEPVEKVGINTSLNIDSIDAIESSEEEDFVDVETGDCINILQYKNGYFIGEKFIDFKYDSIFISGHSKRKNVIAIDEVDSNDKIEILNWDMGAVEVKRPEGFDLARPVGHNWNIVKKDKLVLNKNEKVALTYKNLKFVFQIKKKPPRLKASPFFQMEPLLLSLGIKILFFSFLFVLTSIYIAPKQVYKVESKKQREVVVHYQKKAPIVEEKIVEENTLEDSKVINVSEETQEASKVVAQTKPEKIEIKKESKQAATKKNDSKMKNKKKIKFSKKRIVQDRNSNKQKEVKKKVEPKREYKFSNTLDGKSINANLDSSKLFKNTQQNVKVTDIGKISQKKSKEYR